MRKLADGKILAGGVGTGKSKVAATYYKNHHAPKDVYVITTARKRDDGDWAGEFYKLGIGPRTGPSGPQPPKRAVRTTDSGAQRGNEGLGFGPTGLDSVLQPQHRADTGQLHLGDARLGRTDSASEHADVVGGLSFEAGQYPWVLTVDSWNNIAKYADVAGAFFIFDEQRLVGSGNWVRKFLRIAKRNDWILLSATPGDTWMDYIPVFVANDFYKNRSEFIREHVVYSAYTKFPKVDRYINQGRLLKYRARLLVEMPYLRRTTRHHVPVVLPYDKDLLDQVLNKRWHVYEERPLRDVAEMFSVARRVVNSDPSRLEKVYELWEKHPRLIIFYNFNYELESLRSLNESLEVFEKATGTRTRTDGSGNGVTTSMPSSIDGSRLTKRSSAIHSSTANAKILKGRQGNCATTDGDKASGAQVEYSDHTCASRMSSRDPRDGSKRLHSQLAEWNGHKHQAVPTGDRWVYLVQYTAGAEAWNCITTDTMVLYSQNYSWRIMEQAYGRNDRLNTPFKDLWYYGLTSDSWVDRAIARALRAKETFNERKYAGLFRD